MGQEPRGSKTTGLTRLMGIVLLVVAVLFWVTAPGRAARSPRRRRHGRVRHFWSWERWRSGSLPWCSGGRYSGATGGISIPAAGWARNVVERVRGYTQDLSLLPPAPPRCSCSGTTAPFWRSGIVRG